jgi:hypothetical protein
MPLSMFVRRDPEGVGQPGAAVLDPSPLARVVQVDYRSQPRTGKRNCRMEDVAEAQPATRDARRDPLALDATVSVLACTARQH